MTKRLPLGTADSPSDQAAGQAELSPVGGVAIVFDDSNGLTTLPIDPNTNPFLFADVAGGSFAGFAAAVSPKDGKTAGAAGQPAMSQAQPSSVSDAVTTIGLGIAAAAAAGAATVVSAGGMTFDLLYDAAAMAAPAAFRTSIEQAATQLSQAISNRITVNITIHYSGTGGGASAKPDNGAYESYSTVRTDLINGAAAGDTSFNALPNTTSIQGQSQVLVTNAQLKLFGLLSANDTTTDDGEATFATDISTSNLVSVALHEITHAIGRVPFGSQAAPSPDIFDLFRFTSAGTRLFTSAIPSSTAYFSVDNGTTKLADYGKNSDPSDFLNTGVQGSSDPFNEFYSNSTTQALSSVDLEQLDVLGFRVTSSASLTIALKNDTGASSSDNLTNDATLAGVAIPGTTVTLTENGGRVGSVAANAAGNWTFTPPLADGAHTITASEINGQGQTVTASQTFSVATRAPTISGTASVSGQTSQTSDTLTLSAAAESVGANAISGVEIFDGAADVGAATPSGGNWTLTATNLLPGAHNFTAKATDSAGNVGSFALPQVVVSGSIPSNGYTLADFGFTGSSVTDIRPKGINDSGEIVGYYVDGRADDVGADGLTYYEHGFYSTVDGTGRQYSSIEDPDTPTDTQNGEPSAPDRTRAFAVNNTGDIVGWYAQDEIGYSSAGNPYVLPDAGYIDSANWPNTYGKLGFSQLNDLGTHALGINSSDQIVGYYNDGSGYEHGFFRDFTGYGVRGSYISFDAPFSVNTVAEGINDSGQIVGFYQNRNGTYHGFSLDSSTGAFTPIDFNGATNTEALGINNRGEIVGFYLDSTGSRHGFVRSTSGHLTTIDDPSAGSGGTLVGGINNRGEIVGWYTGPDGHDHGYTGLTAATAASTTVSNDFFNAGRSAILWRNGASGEIYEWNVNGTTPLSYTSLYRDPSWRPVGTGNFFNADSSGDRGGIVWQNSQTGQALLWRIDGSSYVTSTSLYSDPTWLVVGTGDANGDGTTDIFWRNTTSGAVSEWQMNNGAAPAQQIIYTDLNTTIVATGDFWGDGHSDLVVRNPTTGNVTIDRLNGFAITEQDTIFTDPAWTVVGTGDFNGDGNSDLLWYNAATGQTYIWQMNGAQTLASQQIYQDPNWRPVATGDYNGDGRSDILWHNNQTGQTAEWLMNGFSATSQSIILVDANWTPVGNGNNNLTTTTQRATLPNDFAGEGRSGIEWRNADTGQTYLWTMKGFVQETGGSIYQGDPNWEGVTTGDLNGDGKTDLIFRNRLSGEVQEYQMNGLQVVARQTLFIDPTWKVVGSGDFNGDSKSDLVWQNVNSGQIYIWEMNGFATLAAAPVLTDANFKVVGTGDFFGTGTSALLLRNAETGETDIMQMNGTQVVARQALFTDRDWVPVGTGDFNGDGRTDIIWRNGITGQVYEWQMNGFNQIAAQPLFTDPQSRVVAVGDYTGIGRSSLLTQNVYTGAVIERQFNGFNQTAQQTIFTDPSWSPNGARAPVAATDLYGAGRSDIVFTNGATGQVSVWQQNGATTLSQTTLFTDPTTQVVGAGDYFGTGKSGLVLDNTTTGAITLRQMNGSSVVGNTTLLQNTNVQVAATGVDSDGTGHVYLRDTSSGQVSDLHLNNGVVSGSPVGLYTDLDWVPVATGDFNGDGKADLVWQNSQNGQVSEWLMDGTHPITQTIINTNSQMKLLGAGDFTGNGRSDLLFQNTITGKVDEWWMNGSTVSSVHTLFTDLTATVVGIGDYNGDGIADVLVRNGAGATQLWTQDHGSIVSMSTITTDPNLHPFAGS